MESRILGFIDAMRLAEILYKYSQEVTPETRILDFLEILVDKISPLEYLEVLKLLSGENMVESIKGDGAIRMLVSGLEKNNFIGLLSTYRKFMEV